MSDDDFFMDDYDDGDEFDGGDDDDEEIVVENNYYTSKDLEQDEGLDAAIKGFQGVITLEKEKNGGDAGRWSFKATKKLLPLYVKKGDFGEIRRHFLQLLEFGKSTGVTENDLFKSVSKFIDVVSGSPLGDSDEVEALYDEVLGAWRQRSEGMWFKMALKLSQRLYERRRVRQLPELLAGLRRACEDETGRPDMAKKGNQLLDVLSLEIQLAMDRRETKRVQDLYELGMETARQNPGVLNQKIAIFHFVGGKVRMEAADYDRAYQSFFEAFKFFEEAGSRFKVPCLQYIIVANMLLSSRINPFSTPETRNMQAHAEIRPFSDLLDAYQSSNIAHFEKVLKDHRALFSEDVFVSRFIGKLLRGIRTQSLVEIISPYTSVRMPHLAKLLNIDVAEVRELLICLILDGKLPARIDEVTGVVAVDVEALRREREREREKEKQDQTGERPGPADPLIAYVNTWAALLQKAK